jgi:CHAT domain-containing protein
LTTTRLFIIKLISIPALLFVRIFFVTAQETACFQDSLYRIEGERYFNLNKFDSAAKYLEKSFLLGKTGQPKGSIHWNDIEQEVSVSEYFHALLQLGSCYNFLLKPSNALIVLETGIKQMDSARVAAVKYEPLFHYQAGNSYVLMNEYALAIGSYQKALNGIAKEDPLIQQIDQNLGGIFYLTGDYENAIEHYQKALLFNPSLLKEDPVKGAELFSNLGSVNCQIKEFSSALKYFNKVSEIIEQMGFQDTLMMIRNSLNMGIVYCSLDDLASATACFKQSKGLHSLVKGPDDELLMICSAMALLNKKIPAYDSAVYYLKLAVSLAYGKDNLDSMAVADLYRELGDVYELKGELQNAIRYYQEALPFIRITGSHFNRDSHDQFTDLPNYLELFRIRSGLARLRYKNGIESGSGDEISRSFDEYLLAIDLTNRINNAFGRDGSRFLFNETAKGLYYGAIEAGYSLSLGGQKDLADTLFKLSEEARSRILYSSFMKKIAKKVSGVPDSLLVMEEQLMDDVTDDIGKLYFDSTGSPVDRRAHYLSSLDKLIADFIKMDTLSARFEQSSPIYKILQQQDEVLGYADVRNRFLNDEAILEYLVGDSSLFIFLAKRDSLILKRVLLPQGFRNDILAFNNAIKGADVHDFYPLGRKLYRLLIGPVKCSLSNIRKLIVIPDEYLATIPFEALVCDTADPAKHGGHVVNRFIINEFEVGYHLSSSFWRTGLSQSGGSLFPLKYAGFAPALRHEGRTLNNVTTTSINDDGIIHVNNSRFANLPNTRKEILQVAELISENKGEASVFLGGEATEKNFRQVIKENNIIHIATHSLIDEEEPDLSGLLFYPDAENPGTDSRNSGVLLMNEIYNLKITADLVVLSACATGTGKITRSEGILALNRGFLAAGASNILYTLWNITDKHTKDFITSFFKEVIAGQSYSAALRNAKLEMILHPETSFPKLWAGYILMGK